MNQTFKRYSPLRYPGGKGAFSPIIFDVIDTNKLSSGHYLEPYAGGAGVALALLLKNKVAHVHINDLDPAIYSFWIAVTKHSSALIDLIEKTPITMDSWFFWRDVLRNENENDPVIKGFSTLFMNRTNRSGILKAGVIGGKEQSGNYKLDARFNKISLISKIESIAMKSESISVYCEDSLSLIKKCDSFLPSNSLIYFDPPYYKKGKGLYRNYYEHEDHEKLAKFIQSKNFKPNWIVSYDNTEEINEMYKFSKSLSYSLNYVAQRRYIGNEVMFFSKNLNIDKDIFLNQNSIIAT